MAKKTVKKVVKKTAAQRRRSSGSPSLHRFAHPFFTTVAPEARPVIKDVGQRATDFSIKSILEIPAPLRDPTMELAEIVGKSGADEIANSSSITFHATGDTGNDNDTETEMVSDAMTSDYDISNPKNSPAFFLHLGDVNYYENNDQGYSAQFYKPYKRYPGKIIAIPGNHDGEIFKYNGASVGQKKTLEAFMKNFCQAKSGVPSAASATGIYREMISQPGVYWRLDAPFVDIIGLYSNMAESPGYIAGGKAGSKQKVWLAKTLKTIADARKKGPRKALIIAVHHPPLSQGGHSGSVQMLKDIDECCVNAVAPDAVFAAHAHSLQVFTRYVNFAGKAMEVPYIVCGGGGRGLQNVSQAPGPSVKNGDHSFDKSKRAYGYTKVKVDAHSLTIEITEVDKGAKSHFYTMVVDLATNKIKSRV